MSMPPEITPEARRSKVASSLTAFLEAIHCAKIDSRWIMLLCDNNDRPERVEIPDDRTMNTYAVLTKRKQFLEQMHSLSLQRLIGATNTEYLQMLKDCGFAVEGEKRSQHGVSMQLRLTPFQNFVTTQGLIGVETEKAKVKGMKKVYFLRIGRKQPGYCKSVLEQVRSGIPGMPRILALGQI